MINHIKWSFVSSAIQALGQFLQMLVAAWYLSPESLGIWASLMLLYRLMTPLIEGGWSRLIIQQNNISTLQRNTLYSYNVLLGAVLAALIVLLSPFASQYFQIPDRRYFIIFSLAFIFIGFGVQSNVLLQKELKFDSLAKIQIVGVVLELFIFYVLLNNNLQIWAFIIAFVVKIALQNLLFFVIEPSKKQFEHNYQSVKTIIHWSKYDLGAQLLNYLYTNLDNIFVLHFLGKEALGLYTLAWDTAVKSSSFFSPIITRVYYPLMAKAKDITPLYNKGLTILMAFQIPFYCFLIFYSKEIVFFLYGSKWENIVEPIKWLSFVALLRSSGALGSSVFLICKKFKAEFYFQVFNTILVFTILLVFTINITLISIAKAMLLCHIVIISIWHYYIWKIGNANYVQLFFRLTAITIISLLVVYFISLLKI